MGTRFDMIGLCVGDLRKMVDFYHGVLGIDSAWDGEGPYAEFSHEGIRFAMYEQKELAGLPGKEPGYPRGLNGTFELAINVGDHWKGRRGSVPALNLSFIVFISTPKAPICHRVNAHPLTPGTP
jgi:catechol 2,3-dioxygenase-like lactoylglutathione lyase family enzyme